ncbi:hypothetical protein A2223_04615 [Candidatus Falkowbacteria bacterium RIFOXYA2_FULL_35_8]|uniref:Cell envelope-related transcriptional attenuator domain-containing protein n=1 Tax=Candidatus Falkowbacteria bacterium RIFOXYC2_FULL_36_12 TaxID=1798002 RepID=A0A1F5SW52_9BACT|nr:MAG: hypothetical protein A2478_00255 [Candidatus Falkowbacteria bacterium RIFOXYC2_FULL_36_12]OGF34251.1 MAG: hypothetical protein A2223_04615 [Candidatus Falkowbacteria bacterium RIFOXYA2_FULL_35_8]
MKRIFFKILIVILVIISGVISYLVFDYITASRETKALRAAEKAREELVDNLIQQRRLNTETSEADPFGPDDIVNVLLIGLDSRLGQTNGHCDAIQLISINRKNNSISITAVPRGTYTPLPGTGYKPTDYYVSNSCGLIGLDYGVNQIERIIGQKADFLVLVNFSTTMGILRALNLPTTETLQWLRNRQTYAIGEPQRARNHSNFLKKILTDYTSDQSKTDAVWQYLIFKMLKTDLSFDQALIITKTVSSMDLAHNSSKIKLFMKPEHNVVDITYDPEKIADQLSALNRLINRLPAGDYSGETETNYQLHLLQEIEANMKNYDFIVWAFQNNLWLQIEDSETRNSTHFELLKEYIEPLDLDTKEALIADFINEMDVLEHSSWSNTGKNYLKILVG